MSSHQITTERFRSQGFSELSPADANDVECLTQMIGCIMMERESNELVEERYRVARDRVAGAVDWFCDWATRPDKRLLTLRRNRALRRVGVFQRRVSQTILASASGAQNRRRNGKMKRCQIGIEIYEIVVKLVRTKIAD